MSKETETAYGLNIDYEVLSRGVAVPKEKTETAPAEGEQVPKRRGRPPKNRDEIVPAQQPAPAPVGNLFSTNTPYINSYKESLEQYDYIASQANVMVNDLKTQFDLLKNNKVMKNKFMHLNECAGAINSLLSTEINCVREKNKIYTDCHNFEMKRAQAQKASEAAVSDAKYTADLYQAYINMPTQQQIPNNPITMTAALANNNPAYQFQQTMDDSDEYAAFAATLTPEQNRMIIGDAPNIETVVFYNDATDEKYFGVIDTNTNQLVPNYPLPDPMMLQGAEVNKLTMTVSNSNYGLQWRLVAVGPNGNF